MGNKSVDKKTICSAVQCLSSTISITPYKSKRDLQLFKAKGRLSVRNVCTTKPNGIPIQVFFYQNKKAQSVLYNHSFSREEWKISMEITIIAKIIILFIH